MTKKVTLASLKATEHTFKLEHPVAGELEAWIRIRSPRNNDYFYRSLELADVGDDAPIRDRVKASAELAALLIVDWDQDFFEQEFTVENALDVFTAVENFWIRDQVVEKANQADNFFAKG